MSKISKNTHEAHAMKSLHDSQRQLQTFFGSMSKYSLVWLGQDLDTTRRTLGLLMCEMKRLVGEMEVKEQLREQSEHNILAELRHARDQLQEMEIENASLQVRVYELSSTQLSLLTYENMQLQVSEVQEKERNFRSRILIDNEIDDAIFKSQSKRIEELEVYHG